MKIAYSTADHLMNSKAELCQPALHQVQMGPHGAGRGGEGRGGGEPTTTFHYRVSRNTDQTGL